MFGGIYDWLTGNIPTWLNDEYLSVGAACTAGANFMTVLMHQLLAFSLGSMDNLLTSCGWDVIPNELWGPPTIFNDYCTTLQNVGSQLHSWLGIG